MADSAKTILAFDYGARRIGVASGNLLTRSASALTTLEARDEAQLWTALDQLIAEWRPDQLLVGLPESDASGSIRRLATEFGAALSDRYGIPLDMVAEHLTSFAARSQLKEARQRGVKTRQVKRKDIDAVAAQLIAEQWLNEQHL